MAGFAGEAVAAHADLADGALPFVVELGIEEDGLVGGRARSQLRTSYDMIEQQMAQGPWAMGEAFTLADCSAWPALFYGNIAEPFGNGRKQLTAYFERLQARPSVMRVMEQARPYFHMLPQEN